jgi:hypothetical protein
VVVIAGLTAGAAGTAVAILLSLPLRSPDDVFFNAATVALGGLLASVAAGLAWSRISHRATAVRYFVILVAGAFAIVAVAALAGEALFERTASYAIPLAAVIFGAIALLTPTLSRMHPPAWIGGAALVPVIALGALLAESGDEQSTPLALPAVVGTAPAGATAASGAPTAAASTAASGASTGQFRTPADVQGVRFIVGEGSQSQFTVREQLSSLPLPNDATVRNTALKGDVHLDGRPTTVEIDLTGFTSDQPRRDNFIRQMWGRQPIARVTIDSIGALPAEYTAGEVVRRQVSGRLSILGSEAPITFDVEARLDGGTLSVLGTTKFRWADFNMRAPNTPTVRVEDEVSAQILLIAQAG